MTDGITILTMTDQKVFCGKVTAFYPREGWLSISDDAAPAQVFLRDMYSALQFRETARGVTDKLDVKELALGLGWDGR